MSKNVNSNQNAETGQGDHIVIAPPNMQVIEFRIVGTSPLVQAKFSKKARLGMMENMSAGSTSRSKKKREARDFDEDFRESIHFASEGWIGIPASAFRNAAIDVCRMVGFKMTHAKQAVFIEADGLDADEGSPLVKLDADEPERLEMRVRNSGAGNPTDIRVRPMWREWAINLRVRFDADQFTATDIANLIMRAGLQVGIGEGRPYGKSSNGLGFGLFTIENN